MCHAQNHTISYNNYFEIFLPEVIYTVTVAPFLRTKSKIVPAVQPEFYNHKLDAAELTSVFTSMKALLKAQMERFDNQGLLDWGAAESKVKGLMGRFQR